MSAQTDIEQAAADAKAAAAIMKEFTTGDKDTTVDNGLPGGIPTLAKFLNDVGLNEKYLGAKASDPTLDNNGNALQAGAIYLNTTLQPNQLKIYHNGTWNTPTEIEAALRADLASTESVLGAGLVGLTQGGTVRDAVKWVTPQMFLSLVVGGDWAPAIQWAIDALHADGGGDVVLPLLGGGAAYETGATIVMKEGVKLRGEGWSYSVSTSSPFAARLLPRAAVTTGISALRQRPISIDGVQVDMSNMPDGSLGIDLVGVWMWEVKNCAAIGITGANSIGFRGRAAGSPNFGTFFGRLVNFQASDGGTGLVLDREPSSTTRVTSTILENINLVGCAVGARFANTGSGIVCLNLYSEGNTSHGLVFENQTQNVVFVGGEIAGNGGWGATGTAGRVTFHGTAFATNTLGDRDLVGLVAAPWLRGTAANEFRVEGNFRVVERPLFSGTSQTLSGASDTISSSRGKVRLTSAAPITMTSNPQIAVGVDNQILILAGTSNTNTIELVDGNGLALNGNCVLGLNDTLMLFYDFGGSNLWVELARSNN
jgi:hypothetical protein